MPEMDLGQKMSMDDLGVQISGRRKRLFLLVCSLSCAIVLTYFLCLFLGAVDLSYKDVIDVWTGHGTRANTQIVENMRMPRVACAAIVGAGLSIAGMAMQAMFRNPMAGPSVLGLSSGAAFGACLALGLGMGGIFGAFSLPLMAFFFCFLTIFLVYMLASTRYGVPTVLLLLAGIAVGTFFGGLSSMIQYSIEADALQQIVYWTMGSFAKCDWTSVLIGGMTVGLGTALIVSCRKELNLLAMGEEQAKTLGINMRAVRIVLLIGTSLVIGGSVSISGIIGFVGLIIPHVCRALIGPNHIHLWPICLLVGAVFLMVIDLVSRTAMDTIIPVGVLTSLIGAPFFIYIMRKKKNELWG